MEPILKTHDKIKGTEILFFEDAEIEKTKGGNSSFASSGPLSVLYFKDYSRFMLHLNDWKYPLMRRLPVSSQGGDGNSRIFEFPALNGFTYRLKINNVANNAGLSNLESILDNNSSFSIKGATGIPRKLEASPDDKLFRHQKEKESGPTEVIKEVIKQGLEKVKIASETLKSGTKKLTSRKKKMELKDIKNRNFRKNAKSTFKKDFFTNGEKLSKEFLEKRRANKNLSESRDFKDLLKTSDAMAPSLYLWRVEVEEAILNNKDLIQQGNYKLSEEQTMEKKGIMESIKQGLHDIKDSVTGMMGHAQQRVQQERGREGLTKPSTEPKTGLETMHYQG